MPVRGLMLRALPPPFAPGFRLKAVCACQYVTLHVASKDQEWRTISFWLGTITTDHPSTLAFGGPAAPKRGCAFYISPTPYPSPLRFGTGGRQRVSSSRTLPAPYHQ